MDDLDSLFDDNEENVQINEMQPDQEEEQDFDGEGFPLPDQAEAQNIPIEEPVPIFESQFDMYIFYARKYLTEMCLASIMLVYILNFFVGKGVNSKIATMWLTQALPVLRDNFAHLGFGNQTNAHLSQITYDEFEYYASGRDNMGYVFINLRTKKRQDVITGGLFGVIWPENDRIIMDIPIGTEMPLELIVCRDYDIKKQFSEMPHLKGLAKSYEPASFKETNLGFIAESPEVINHVFSKKFVNLLTKYEKYLEFLHITDQRVYTNNPLVLKAEIRLGDRPAEYENSINLFQALIELVDHIVTNVKLPTQVIEKARKKRTEEQKQKNKEKEDEEREKKQEEKDQKLREKLATMTPAQKKKYLEKLENQEKKKAMKGRNKVVKF